MRVCGWLVMIVFLVAEATADDVFLRLYPVASTTTGTVSIQSLGRIQGESQWLGRFGQYAIALDAEQTHVSQAQIREVFEMMRKDAGDPKACLHLLGPQHIRLNRVVSQIEGEQIVQMARQALAASLAEVYEDFTVSAVGKVADLELAEAGAKVQIVPVDLSKLGKRMPVWVQIEAAETQIKRFPVWFELSVHAPVPVLSMDVSARQPLQALAYETQVMDITRYVPVATTEQLAGSEWLLKTSASKGTVVTIDMLFRRPPVLMGTRVKAFAGIGKVVVEAPAVAITDGMLGEIISVKSLSSNEQFKAKVIAKDQVYAVDGAG